MAKRFRFNLQPVLRYREIIEGDKKKDFAVANRHVEEQSLQMEKLRETRDMTQHDVRELYQGKAPFRHIVAQYRYINTLDLNLAMGSNKLKQLQAVRDEKRATFIEARRDRRALELLREKRAQQHEYELNREEQTTLDEIAVRVKRQREEKAL